MGRSRQRGFTLIELLVGVALTGLIMSVVTSLSFQFIRTFYQAEGLHRLQREVVFGVEAIYTQLKVANDVRDVSLGGSDDRVYKVYGLDYDPFAGQDLQLGPVEIRLDAATHSLYVGERCYGTHIAKLDIALAAGGELDEYEIAVETVDRYGLVPASRLPIKLTARARIRNYRVVYPGLRGLPEAVADTYDVHLTWQTNMETAGEVRYRKWDPVDPQPWTPVVYDSYLSLHSMDIGGLEKETTYDYRIYGYNMDGLEFETPIFSFTTQDDEIIIP